MILSSELLPNWDRKKMNFDEQISKKLDKQMLNELVNENAISSNFQKKFKKGVFYCPFFYPKRKILKCKKF